MPDPNKDLMWWGYKHANGSYQLKRWWGDHKDYQDDCEGNVFIAVVVPPFVAATRDEAFSILSDRLN